MTCKQTHGDTSEVLVSFVLPLFNESGILRHLTYRIREVMSTSDYQFELVYVNDGSTDESGLILDELAANDSRIVVLHLSRNFGHQAAVHAGLEQSRGAAVIVMDSDLQDNPAAVPEFLAQWESGFDVVYAERRNRKEATWKRLLFFAFYRILNTVADIRIPQDAGNFGLLDRRVVDILLSLPESDRYFAALRSWVGFRQTGIPVERDARYDEKTRVSLRELFGLAKNAVYSFSTFPLTLFTTIAVLSACVCVTSSVFVIWHKVVTGLAISGWASVIITTSFFGMLNALGISVLGEYVIRIYNQVRNRPTHLVARKTSRPATRPVRQPSAGGNVSETRFLEMVHQIDRTLVIQPESPHVVARAAETSMTAQGHRQDSSDVNQPVEIQYHHQGIYDSERE